MAQVVNWRFPPSERRRCTSYRYGLGSSDYLYNTESTGHPISTGVYGQESAGPAVHRRAAFRHVHGELELECSTLQISSIQGAGSAKLARFTGWECGRGNGVVLCVAPDKYPDRISDRTRVQGAVRSDVWCCEQVECDRPSPATARWSGRPLCTSGDRVGSGSNRTGGQQRRQRTRRYLCRGKAKRPGVAADRGDQNLNEVIADGPAVSRCDRRWAKGRLRIEMALTAPILPRLFGQVCLGKDPARRN
jgi:hypothetical protein